MNAEQHEITRLYELRRKAKRAIVNCKKYSSRCVARGRYNAYTTILRMKGLKT
jgi:hypothetical protein